MQFRHHKERHPRASAARLITCYTNFPLSRCKSLESALDRVVSRCEKNPSVQWLSKTALDDVLYELSPQPL